MPPDDDIRATGSDYTYNELNNEEKEWVSRNGYRPGELSEKEVRRLMEEDRDSDENSEAIGEIGDEMDGTDADAS
jgi:hypothetical protein